MCVLRRLDTSAMRSIIIDRNIDVNLLPTRLQIVYRSAMIEYDRWIRQHSSIISLSTLNNYVELTNDFQFDTKATLDQLIEASSIVDRFALYAVHAMPTECRNVWMQLDEHQRQQLLNDDDSILIQAMAFEIVGHRYQLLISWDRCARCATRLGFDQAMQRSLAQIIDINERRQLIADLLMIAIEWGHLSMIEWLWNGGNIDVDSAFVHAFPDGCVAPIARISSLINLSIGRDILAALIDWLPTIERHKLIVHDDFSLLRNAIELNNVPIIELLRNWCIRLGILSGTNIN